MSVRRSLLCRPSWRKHTRLAVNWTLKTGFCQALIDVMEAVLSIHLDECIFIIYQMYLIWMLTFHSSTFWLIFRLSRERVGELQQQVEDLQKALQSQASKPDDVSLPKWSGVSTEKMQS